MKDIKMSDVFALPVAGAAVHVNIFQLKGHHNDGETPFALVDAAINNHDRLTEENKRLRDALENISEYAMQIPNHYRGNNSHGERHIGHFVTQIIEHCDLQLKEQK